jgi:adenylate cyclase
VKFKHKELDSIWKQMDIATARSEFKRIQVFIIALFIGLAIMSINFFGIEGTTDFFKRKGTKFFVLGWFLTFLLYELSGYFIAKYFLKRKIIVPNYMKISNVIIESVLPGVLLFILCYREQSIIFLDSPIIFFYFILITLSALNLEMRLSLIIGIVSSGSYLFVTYWAIHTYDKDHSVLYFPPVLYYARSLFMFMTALGSTFVAIDIKKRYRSMLNMKLERDEIGRIFDQQVSKEVADILLKDEFSSRRRNVSILFLDIRNYSSYAETLSPEEVIAFQNIFFSPILEIINQYNGITNQILGDGLMATFGVLDSSDGHAQQSYEAALAILEKIKILIAEGEIPKTEIGIGIHTGEVVTGNIGNELRKQFSISGTAVIIAARVEQANKQYNTNFLLTNATKALIQVNGRSVESIGKVKMKNIAQEIELFKVSTS